MDYAPHWATMCKCSLCGEIPDVAPLYHCPYQHQYCGDCYEELKRNYYGTLENGCTCSVCKTSAKFEKSKVNTDFLRKLKIKPGIGRPFRYGSKALNSSKNGTSSKVSSYVKYNNQPCYHTSPANGSGDPVTVEELFQLSSDEVKKLLTKKPYDTVYRTPSCTVAGDELDSVSGEFADLDIGTNKFNYYYQSKKPLLCPHDNCKRTVAVSAFVNHFRYEHKDLPVINVERGKDIIAPCNLMLLEHGSSCCMAMITVYEINKIDVIKSKSSKSVIRTCSKFSQTVPINTFWLMASASKETRPNSAYAFFWLFTNTEDSYQCTLEMSSKNDTTSISTFCSVINCTDEHDTFSKIPESLNCLLLSYHTIISLLKEGLDLKLRITVH